ncbi:MAG: transglutaminase-like domain-containing protein [bacterium]
MIDTKEVTLEKSVIGNNEFDYLIRLLDDEDENIYSSIKDRFILYGDNSSEFLKKYLNDENTILKKRANEIISIINFENIEDKFRALSLNNNIDFLEEGIFLIASYGYPAVNINDYKCELDKMVADIEAQQIETVGRLNRANPLGILNTINNYLFFEKKFIGNTDNYFEEDNSYINKVMDSKLGIPISLCIIYILISRRLSLPVYGINLPGHFILKYSDGYEEFFIDPFNKGVIISIKEAEEFVKKIGMSKDDFDNIPYLKKTNDKEIILRVLRNLVEIFKKKSDIIKSEQLEKLMLTLA